MSLVECDGVQLALDRAGEGAPLVLVHGSWADRSTWEPVFASLAQRFDTIRYDRRGYGQSQRPGVGPARHVTDLVALIRTLRLARVLLVANSMGGVIAAGAALAVPELVQRVIVHEPPLFKLLEDSPENQTVAVKTRQALNDALDAERSGNHELSAQLYVEQVAGATGAWRYLPPEIQRTFLQHAQGFLADATPGDEYEPSIADLRQLEARLVITRGLRSPQFLKIIADRLCCELNGALNLTFSAAGHVPHQTCPRDFTSAIVRLAAGPLR